MCFTVLLQWSIKRKKRKMLKASNLFMLFRMKRYLWKWKWIFPSNTLRTLFVSECIFYYFVEFYEIFLGFCLLIILRIPQYRRFIWWYKRFILSYAFCYVGEKSSYKLIKGSKSSFLFSCNFYAEQVIKLTSIFLLKSSVFLDIGYPSGFRFLHKSKKTV